MIKIALLLTGNELMSGHTVDSNSAMIADKLSDVGLSISRKVTIGDDEPLLIAEIQQLSASANLLIINGGLGPTIDDLTASALAKACAVDLIEHPLALQHLSRWCNQRQLSLNQANRKQAWLPRDARIIANPIGSAVGFATTLNDCLIICTPGVPSELRAMLDDSIVSELSSHFGMQATGLTLRLQTFGLGESSIQQRISEHYPDWPAQLELGFRAGMPQLEIKLRAKSSDDLALRDHWEQKLRTLLGDHIIGADNTTLGETVVHLLQQRRQQLCTAESCTGGLIASQITAIPGASAVYGAGLVSYSNAMKTQLLAVPAALLAEHGAVSQAVVESMAANAMRISGADYGIAVSGIAGPTGASADKPVGSVWLAWGTQANLHSQALRINGDRRWFQQMVSAVALDLIRRELLGIAGEPAYFKRWARKT